MSSSCDLPVQLQDDEVYKNMTDQEKVALWEQGLCPGNEVGFLHKEQLLLKSKSFYLSPDCALQSKSFCNALTCQYALIRHVLVH